MILCRVTEKTKLNYNFTENDSTVTQNCLAVVFFLLLFMLVVNYMIGSIRNSAQSLLVISFDGFRYDYIEMVKRRFGNASLPNFDKLIKQGVRGLEFENVFPTSTLPNHQSLVTGLYPQYTGITANVMFDKRYPGTVFSMNNVTSLVEDPWLDGWPEPIWKTAQRFGIMVGTLLWPLTDRPIIDDLPFQCVSYFKYNAPNSCYYPNNIRMRDIVHWLFSKHYKLGLILAYFSDIDAIGHTFGPNSKHVLDAVLRLDDLLGYLINQLEARKMHQNVNIILLSDHGMTEVSKDRLIVLDKLVDSNLYAAAQLSSIGYIFPIKGEIENVYKGLKNRHPHLSVYKLSEVPSHLVFNIPGPRMPPILIIADIGWTIVQQQHGSFPTTAGQHGYPPGNKDMHGIFIASGPAFLRSVEIPKVHLIDLYSLMCHLIGIPPKPNNGSFTRIASILRGVI